MTVPAWPGSTEFSPTPPAYAAEISFWCTCLSGYAAWSTFRHATEFKSVCPNWNANPMIR